MDMLLLLHTHTTYPYFQCNLIYYVSFVSTAAVVVVVVIVDVNDFI